MGGRCNVCGGSVYLGQCVRCGKTVQDVMTAQCGTCVWAQPAVAEELSGYLDCQRTYRYVQPECVACALWEERYD